MNQSVEKSNARRQVTAVGDSWIVGKSKSHPGFTYYFNTLTGEAVWNLSAAEVIFIVYSRLFVFGFYSMNVMCDCAYQ